MVTETFEMLGIGYAIGGSLASSVHGVVHVTHDADIIAQVRTEHVDRLIEELGSGRCRDNHSLDVFVTFLPPIFASTYLPHAQNPPEILQEIL